VTDVEAVKESDSWSRNYILSPTTLKKTLRYTTLEADNIATHVYNLCRSESMTKPVQVKDFVAL